MVSTVKVDGRVAERHAAHDAADDEAADDVDDDDHHAGDRVALHELHGTVHGAEEGALALEVLALLLGLLGRDDAVVHLRVDRHLLARHGVEGEARRDFRDATGALGDDDELHDHDDDEHDDADHGVAGRDELTERLDDVPGGFLGVLDLGGVPQDQKIEHAKEAAGHVVKTFGELVAAGNAVIGIVMFIIIMVVQFVIVAQGAGRVSEVAARFTLDAMPGKQMAIDAEMNNRIITPEEAKQKREDLERESAFFGAMDGAMKFVKGDAIAGMVIVVVNIIGGLIIGGVMGGMPLGDAAVDVHRAHDRPGPARADPVAARRHVRRLPRHPRRHVRTTSARRSAASSCRTRAPWASRPASSRSSASRPACRSSSLFTLAAVLGFAAW